MKPDTTDILGPAPEAADDRWRLAQLLGAAKAMHMAGRRNQADALQALILIQREELWRAATLPDGSPCGSFDEFLGVHCGLSRSTYYEQKALWEKEGDALYDVLTHIGVPRATRRLLQPNSVVLDGDAVLLNGAERIPLNDKRRLKTLIATLTEKVEKQSRIIEKGEETVKRLKERAAAAERRVQEAQTSIAAREARLTEALLALAAYAAAVRAEPYGDAAARKVAVEQLGGALQAVYAALEIQHGAIDDALADV